MALTADDAREFEAASTTTIGEKFGVSPSFVRRDDKGVITGLDDPAKETIQEQLGETELGEYVDEIEEFRQSTVSQEFQDEFDRRVNIAGLGGVGSADAAEEFASQQVQQARQEQRAEQRRRGAEIVPKLVEVDDNGNKVQELQPDVVSRMGGTLPFDADSVQLQDGQTVTDERGDTNLRLNMEFETSKQGFEKLISMRDSGNRIDLVSATYTKPATFDQLKFDRIADANGVVFADGESRKEARYTIQLQSKEQSEDDSLIQPFSSDN